MEKMLESEKNFIDSFSNSEIVVNDLPSKIKLPIKNKFFTDDIGIKYIGNMLKDIDVRLYLAFLKIAKDKINFVEDYKAENSSCVSRVTSGVVRDVVIVAPHIKNGMNLCTFAHEVGHGLKASTKINNDRYLHSSTIYDETLSILFGRLCLDRYINDFGYDDYAQQFELLNINNALYCLDRLKELIKQYSEKEEELDNTTIKEIKNPRYDDKKYSALALVVEKLQKDSYRHVSYPIGIALANVYDNFDEKQKEEYLEFVSKFLLNLKHIDFEMILEYFGIPFDANFYIQNFQEYIQKFENENSKKLVLGVKK